VFTVLSELVAANENQRRAAVVVLAAADKTEMEDAIRARVPSLGNTRVVCRTGDPADLEDLTMVNVAGARAIVAFAGERDGDAQVVKSVLAVRSHTTRPAAHVVAELRNAHVARNLRMAAGERVLTVQADEIIARVTAQACRHSGLSASTAICSTSAATRSTSPRRRSSPGTPRRGTLASRRRRCSGSTSTGDKVQLLASMATLIAADDASLPSRRTTTACVFTGFAIAGVAHRGGDGPESPAPILVVGWSSLGPLVPSSWTRSFRPVAHRRRRRRALVERDAPSSSGISPTARSRFTRPKTRWIVCRAALEDRYDEVIVLGYRRSLSPAESDARTPAHPLERQPAARCGVRDRRPRVIAEVLDARDVAISEATGADDFVVSDELSSLMLAQLAEASRSLGGVRRPVQPRVPPSACVRWRPTECRHSANWAETVAWCARRGTSPWLGETESSWRDPRKVDPAQTPAAASVCAGSRVFAAGQRLAVSGAHGDVPAARTTATVSASWRGRHSVGANGRTPMAAPSASNRSSNTARARTLGQLGEHQAGQLVRSPRSRPPGRLGDGDVARVEHFGDHARARRGHTIEQVRLTFKRVSSVRASDPRRERAPGNRARSPRRSGLGEQRRAPRSISSRSVKRDRAVGEIPELDGGVAFHQRAVDDDVDARTGRKERVQLDEHEGASELHPTTRMWCGDSGPSPRWWATPCKSRNR